MSELSCCQCGAVLGGHGFKGWDKRWYCTSSCEREAWPNDDEDREPEEPEEDRDGQYDTLEERDMDRIECPSSQFD